MRIFFFFFPQTAHHQFFAAIKSTGPRAHRLTALQNPPNRVALCKPKLLKTEAYVTQTLII